MKRQSREEKQFLLFLASSRKHRPVESNLRIQKRASFTEEIRSIREKRTARRRTVLSTSRNPSLAFNLTHYRDYYRRTETEISGLGSFDARFIGTNNPECWPELVRLFERWRECWNIIAAMLDLYSFRNIPSIGVSMLLCKDTVHSRGTETRGIGACRYNRKFRFARGLKREQPLRRIIVSLHWRDILDVSTFCGERESIMLWSIKLLILYYFSKKKKNNKVPSWNK